MIANFTLIGNRNGSASNDSDQGMLIREGTAGRLYNGLVVNFGDDCIDVDQDATFARIGAGTDPLDIQSVALDCVNNFDESSGDPLDLSDWFLAQPNNVEYTNSLTGFAFFSGGTGVVPGSAETGLTATDVNAIDAWFEPAGYVGAVEGASDTWYQGWTFVPAQQ